MTKLLRILVIVLFTCACGNKVLIKDKHEFYGRIYDSTCQDYKPKDLGLITLEGYLTIFDNEKWSYNYWEEFNSKNYRFTDLEVLDKNNSMYLTISVCPNSLSTYQFEIGIGTHNEEIKNNEIKVKRKIKIYATGSNDPKIPRKIIELFFEREYDKIEGELDKMFLMEETDDLY